MALALAIYYFNSKPAQHVAGINSNLIPGLAENLNEVSGLTIYGAGEKVLTNLVKTEKNWVVKERDDYEADIKLIRNEFDSLKTAKIIEAKTANPDNYSKLGVEDLSTAEAQGIKFSIAGLADAVNIIVGNNGTGDKNTQYVRREGESQTWLIDKKLNLKRDSSQWLRKDIIDIPPERISKITIKHPQEELITIENKGESEYEFVLVNELPEGEKTSESEVYQVANALSSLQLEDVALLKNVFNENVTPVVTTFQTHDGLSISISTFESNEGTYSHFAIEFDPNDVVKEDKLDDSDAALNSDPEAAKKLAETLTARIAQWAYVLPGISQDALVKKTR